MKEPWRQGKVLLTGWTRTWAKKQWDERQAEEEKNIYAFFTEEDKGKGREYIATFRREEDLKRAIECVNACAGIKEPDKFILLARCLYQYEGKAFDVAAYLPELYKHLLLMRALDEKSK